MWCERWTHKEGWVLKNWCFRELMLSFNWCWRRLLRVPWPARRSNQSVLKEINPNYSLEGLMLKLKLQYFGHLMWRTDSFEKTLMLGKIEGRSRRGRQRMRWLNGITDWMDMSLSNIWEKRSLACCSPWGHRVRQDWATEQVGDFIALIAQMPEVSLCPCWLMQRGLHCNHRQHLKDFWQQKCIIFRHCSNMWVFFSTPSNSIIPVGCPTIQLNSDTIYLETTSGPTGCGLSPTRMSPTPFLSYLRRLLLIQAVTCASDQLTIDQRFQQPPLQTQLIC